MRMLQPKKELYTKFLAMKGRARRIICETTDNTYQIAESKKNTECGIIRMANQYRAFRMKLQELADTFINRCVYIEPGTEIMLVDKMVTCKQPLIMYGVNMMINGHHFMELNPVDKHGKIIDFSLNDLKSIERITLNALMSYGNTIKTLPAIVFSEYGADYHLTLSEKIDYFLTEKPDYNGIYHLFKQYSTPNAKEKCIEYLSGKKSEMIERLVQQRDTVIKGYDYIIDHIGTDDFDNGYVSKLYSLSD